MSARGRLVSWLAVPVTTGFVLLAPLAARAAEAGAEGDAHVSDPLGFAADLSIWSTIVFLLFLALLTKLAWKPLTEGLDTRERRIRDDIGAAEQARVKAEQMLAEHAAKLDRVQDEVKAILAEARRDAEVARQNIIATANAEADASKKRAIVEIERARDQALKELFDTMTVGVADATEHVLGRGLTSGDQQQLIDEALARFSERPITATRA